MEIAEIATAAGITKNRHDSLGVNGRMEKKCC